MATLPTS